MCFCKVKFFSLSLFSADYRPPMIPPNRGGGGGGAVGGGGSSSSSTSRSTTTRSPPYYTTPRPLLTTSPGQRYRTTTTVRQPLLIPAGGSSSDTNQIPDINQKAGGRYPPVQVSPAAPQPPILPPQDFCSPRVTADISWPRTQQGQTAKQPCPVGTLGKETRGMDGRTGIIRQECESVILCKVTLDNIILHRRFFASVHTSPLCTFIRNESPPVVQEENMRPRDDRSVDKHHDEAAHMHHIR